MHNKIIYHINRAIAKIKKTILQFFNKTKDESYIFWTTLVFFNLLFVLNPPNKIIAASFCALVIVFWFKIRNLTLSLFYVSISTLIIFSGKNYPIQLLPIGFFPEEIFPQGYFVHLVITPGHIISFLLIIQIVRKLITVKKSDFWKDIKIIPVDILILLFFLLKIFSAVFASKFLQLSLATEVLSLNSFVLYLYARLLIKTNWTFWKNLVFILCSLIIFESIISVPQLIAKSPIYKNVEFQVNIEYFGNAVDENQFSFRPVGTFEHANSLGIWLSSIIIFIFPFIKKVKSNIPWISFMSGLGIIITTISRSAWLGLFFAFIFFVFFGRRQTKNTLLFITRKIWKRRLLFVPIFILLFLFFIIPRIENSFYSFNSDAGAFFYRSIQIRDSFEIIKLHPFLGVGALMGVYEGVVLDLYTMAASIPLQLHNWYFLIALENGVPALFSFIFFVLLSARKLLYYSNAHKPENISTLALLIFIFVVGTFQAYINIGFVILLLSLSNNAIIVRRNA